MIFQLSRQPNLNPTIGAIIQNCPVLSQCHGYCHWWSTKCHQTKFLDTIQQVFKGTYPTNITFHWCNIEKESDLFFFKKMSQPLIIEKGWPYENAQKCRESSLWNSLWRKLRIPINLPYKLLSHVAHKANLKHVHTHTVMKRLTVAVPAEITQEVSAWVWMSSEPWDSISAGPAPSLKTSVELTAEG